MTSVVGKSNPGITAEKLIDKAERLMLMNQLTPVEAAENALPRNLYSIEAASVRELLVTAIQLRIGARDKKRRDSVDERTAVLTNRYVQEAVKAFDGAVKEKAAKLAAIPYVFDGRRYSLLDMPIEGHEQGAVSDTTTIENTTARLAFRKEAVRLLKKERAARIADLPGQHIIALGRQAEAVWH